MSGKTSSNQLGICDFYKTSWNYFSFHANQRISVMNFYIVLESAMAGGFIAVIGMEHGDVHIFEMIIGIAMVFLSFIFFLLDMRTKHMIHLAEKVLRNIEAEYKVESETDILIFNLEEKWTNAFHQKSKIRPLLSYSKLFILLFLFFALLGITAVTYAIIASIC